MDHKELTREEFERMMEICLGRECDKKRPEMLAGAVPIYDHERSKYPDRIRVSFMDGTTMVYDIHTEQPAPVIIENIKIIRKWKQGYVNQPRRRRRMG